MKPEDVIADRTRPFTGAEYMQSLRDGREVYIDGERVADVTTHPAFRNSVRSIARLYDALHDPKHHDVLTCPTDTGSGGYTHRFFRVPRSREDLRGAQAAIAEWSRLTYGWMGRTPDYKAAYSNTLGGNAEYYGPYADNARAWYKRAQETVPFMNHAIVNPPIDRHKPAEQVKDVYVSREEGDRRRHHRLRRQGGRHLGGDHALQLHGPELEDRDRGPGHVADVHGADRRAGPEADLPHLVREGGAAATARRSTIRCRRGSTRTTRSSSWTRCSCPGRTCSSTAIRRAC